MENSMKSIDQQCFPYNPPNGLRVIALVFFLRYVESHYLLDSFLQVRHIHKCIPRV